MASRGTVVQTNTGITPGDAQTLVAALVEAGIP